MISVIVPNWNGADRLRTLFTSLAGQRPIHEILMVDNGSTDQSIEIARQWGARVVALPTNQGFAAAVNRGILEAQADWVAIVNNDVELEPGWLETLSAATFQSGARFATGKLLDATRRDRIDGTYDAISRGATAWRCGSGSPDGPPFNLETAIQLPPFTAVLIDRQVFHEVGPLDEQFESYLEDVDFGLRCAKIGLRGIYVPQAVGYHQGSATLGRWHKETVRRIARNQVLLVAKHYPRHWIRRYGWPILVAQGLWGLLAIRHGAGFPWLRGKIEGIRRFRAARLPSPVCITATLAESERQIRAIQRATGTDPYWRIYFALTGAP